MVIVSVACCRSEGMEVVSFVNVREPVVLSPQSTRSQRAHSQEIDTRLLTAIVEKWSESGADCPHLGGFEIKNEID